MQSYQFSRPKDRELIGFYEKIRLQYADVENNNRAKQHHDAIRLVDTPEEKIFGKVSKEDFLQILDSYARQQSSRGLEEKAVDCDKVDGGNYAKHLFSRPGFHHMGSTAYLAEDLNLEYIQKNSFLGGHHSYTLGEDDNIQALRKSYKTGDVRRSLAKITRHLENDENDQAKREIDKILSIDPKCGDALTARSRYYFKIHRFRDAINDMEESLKYKIADHANARKLLSDYYFEYGLTLYNRRDDRRQLEAACEAFRESLQNNERNQGAKMHWEMCRSLLNQRNNSFTQRPAYRR